VIPREGSVSVDSISPRDRSILVVEDEQLVRAIAVDTLRDAGFNVTEAQHAQDALEALNNADFDLMFTDIRMPGAFDGLRLADLARDLRPQMKIVLTSGHLAEDPATHRAPGMGDFLAKPYRPDTLLACIGALLHR